MDRPILMSAPMVRAIWDGRKSQTRRALKPEPNILNGGKPLNDGFGSYSTEDGWKKLRFAPGDRLWVREAFDAKWGDGIIYRADGGSAKAAGYRDEPRWSPGIHMPRWASRLTLVVTAVKVERLTEISDEDAKAEGIYPRSVIGDDPTSSEWTWQKTGWRYDTPRDAYKALWTEINGPGSWESNPWVAAISFVAHNANIDAIPATSQTKEIA